MELNPREYSSAISVGYSGKTPNNEVMMVVQQKSPKKEEVMELVLIASK